MPPFCGSPQKMMKIITYVNDPFFAIGQSSRLYYMHTVCTFQEKTKGTFFKFPFLTD